MNIISDKTQKEFCDKMKVPFYPNIVGSKLGIALNVRSGIEPINGLRHLPEGETNGWYIWAGEEFSDEDEFFQPLHIEHISDWCPKVHKFLGLPPGWRFLIADSFEDVWFDENLLNTA